MPLALINYDAVHNVKEIYVYDLLNYSNPKVYAIGEIVHTTKRFVVLRYNGSETRFHKMNGQQVGFHWPYQTLAIAPATSK